MIIPPLIGGRSAGEAAPTIDAAKTFLVLKARAVLCPEMIQAFFRDKKAAGKIPGPTAL
ncbi:MAG: hypothetical protein PHF93_04790 [Acidobacteriota bacterium]|jgi:hypothetical protein|nr:hypothetical protein [Acidobacteriota bacterium]HNT31154.1 hypothetical protein [Candidatus Aminicenantes bacterium]MDD8010730.1 hypothetical protein [Acidobacteriota bacterium]MDD8029474.1 hypothetical protein [Acidobacteriota bacterium]MDD8033117.1 hypothetical protein [Acidobacteriota bacterium]